MQFSKLTLITAITKQRFSKPRTRNSDYQNCEHEIAQFHAENPISADYCNHQLEPCTPPVQKIGSGAAWAAKTFLKDFRKNFVLFSTFCDDFFWSSKNATQ